MLPGNSADSKIKCGEIFCYNYNFTIDCNLCLLKSFTLEDFMMHLKATHFNDKLHNTEESNTDCNPFLEVIVKNEAITEEMHYSWDNCQQSIEDGANDISRSSTTVDSDGERIKEDNRMQSDNSKQQMNFNGLNINKHVNRLDDYATKRDVQQINDNLESNTMALKLLLDEIKLIHNVEVPNTLRTVTVLPNKPFRYKEEFINFESSVQASELMVLNMMKELKVRAVGNSTKFIRNSWRLLMNDEAAKGFCWQGSQRKMALKHLATTRAIKQAYCDKFLDHTDAEFEKITIMHFQQAKNRCDRKYKNNT